MPLTLTQATAALESHAPSGQLVPYLNRALERLMSMGGIKGMIEKVQLTVSSSVTPATGGTTTQPTGNLVVSGAGVTAANGVYEPVGSAPYELYAHRTAAGYRIERQLTEWFLRAPDGTNLYTVPYVDGFPDDLGNSWTRCTVGTGLLLSDSEPWGQVPVAAWAHVGTRNGFPLYAMVDNPEEWVMFYSTANANWVIKNLDSTVAQSLYGGGYATPDEVPEGCWRDGDYNGISGGPQIITRQTSTAASPASTVVAETESVTAPDGTPAIPANTLLLPSRYSAILGCIIRGNQTGVAAEWYPFTQGVPLDTAGLPVHPINELGAEPTTGRKLYYVPMFNGDSELTLTARCRLRHEELSSGDSVLPISNLSALGLAVDAVVYEHAGDFVQSQRYFERAVNLLREESQEQEPESQPASPARIVHLGTSNTDSLF